MEIKDIAGFERLPDPTSRPETRSLKCNADGCGHVASDAREYAEHLASHLNKRVLQWSCRCGAFGAGRVRPTFHCQPNGSACWEGVVA